MQEKNTRWTVAGIIVIVVVVGIYLLFGSGRNPLGQSGGLATSTDDTTSSSNQTVTNQAIGATSVSKSTEKLISSETFILSNNIPYSLEYFSVSDAAGNPARSDQRLVSRAGGQVSVVVASVRQAIPDLGRAEILKKFVILQNPNLVVFVSVLPGAGAPYGFLYKFDVATKKFSKMNASRFLPYAISVDANPGVFSSDQTKFLTLRDRNVLDQKETKYLYLVDLLTDQGRSIADVHTGESLTQSLGSGVDPMGVYRWLASYTVEYSVFNADTPLGSSGALRQAIQVRTVQINPDQK